MDCDQLRLAILRVDTVRWVIRDHGARLETRGHRAARYAANVLLVPIVKDYVDDRGNAALDAADHRLLGLLRLKRARGCPPAGTGEPGVTDRQMLDLLEPLMSAKGGVTRAALDRRTELLDRLRESPPEPPPPLVAPVLPRASANERWEDPDSR